MIMATEAGCRVLVVEDSPSSAGVLEAMLRHYGHKVEIAETLAEGLAKLEWEPGCILLDLKLPDGSGIEVLRAVREKGLDIRVAVLTGSRDPELLDEVSALEPDEIFFKPIEANRVMEWLRQVG
jgi:CheY-like chemotaxis protein